MRESRPNLIIRRTQVRENEVEHFKLTGCHEKRLELANFEEDAADRPHVNGNRVFGDTEKEFWCPVPNGHHLVSKWAHWNRECSGKSEISQFELLVSLADEDILWFQISVHDPINVASMNGLQNLFQIGFDKERVMWRLGRVLLPALHLLREIALTILENK